MNDIRVKALLRMFAVLGVAAAGVGALYLAVTFMSKAMLIGILSGVLVGVVLYNMYRVFLSIEEMKERNKK